MNDNLTTSEFYMQTLNLNLTITYTNITYLHHIQPVCNTQQDENQMNQSKQTLIGYLKYETR